MSCTHGRGVARGCVSEQRVSWQTTGERKSDEMRPYADGQAQACVPEAISRPRNLAGGVERLRSSKAKFSANPLMGPKRSKKFVLEYAKAADGGAYLQIVPTRPQGQTPRSR